MTVAAFVPADRSLRRVMGGLVPLSLAVQVCSFGSSVALAHVLGASTDTDAYYLGLSIPVLAYGILIGALRAGAIPTLTAIESRADTAAFGRASSEAFSGVLFASTFLTLIITLVVEAALPALVAGHLLHLTRIVLLELAPYGVLGALTGMLSAVLAVRGKFAAPVVVMMFEPVVKIGLTLGLGHFIGVQALVIGNLFGAALAVGVLLEVLRRDGIRIELRRRFNTPFVRGTARLSVPLIASMSVLQVNPVVDRAMASGVGAGSVTALELGLRLFLVPAGLLTGLLVGPITATWAARMSRDGWPALRASATRAVGVTVAVLPPIVVVGVVLRHELVALLFGGGAYSPTALNATGSVFGMILLALPMQTLIVVFSTLFVLQKDTVFPMKIAFANVALNVALNFAFRPLLGVGGIALSTTLTYTLLLGVYVAAAHRRWGPLLITAAWPIVFRGVTTIAATAVVAVGIAHAIPTAASRAHLIVVIALVAAAAVAAHALTLVLARDPLAVQALACGWRLTLRESR